MPTFELGPDAAERRKHERHRVNGSAWFQWKDTEGTKKELTGSLRNVSPGGVFIETVSPPPVGAEILIKFHFESSSTSPTASITTNGEVSRVEFSGEVSGFAARTGRMNLHRPEGV
jgi:hypothetical protein